MSKLVRAAAVLLGGCSSNDSHGSGNGGGTGATAQGAGGGTMGSSEAAGSGGTATSGSGGAGKASVTGGMPSGGAAPGAGSAGGGAAAGVSSGGAAAGGASSGGARATGGSVSSDGSACVTCTAYEDPPMKLGSAPSALANLSGAAFSWKTPGVLYAHDDGGGGEVDALETNGTVRGRFVLPNSGSIDIEDMGVGPCPDGTCIYLADIGGNRSTRTEYGVLRAAEPAVGASPAASPVELAFVRFRFVYDDHAVHNAESLLVEPKTGALYVITKVAAGSPSSVYKLPQPPDAAAVNTATHVVDLPVPASANREATSASAQPCGGGFLLRTYDALYEFRIRPGAPFEDSFRVTPVLVPSASEPQSEAVAYRADGTGYVSSGEGVAAPIYGVSCR